MLKKVNKEGCILSLEENKAIVRRLFEVFDKKNLDLLGELVAQDYVDHPRQFQGLENYKQHLSLWFKSFPDSHETIEDIVAEGDRVCIRIKGAATHKGEYRGLAPTGKKITWKSVSIYRIVDGKVVERETVRDLLDMGLQLGFIEIKGFPASK